MSGQLPTTPEANSAKINSQQHTLISQQHQVEFKPDK